MVAVDRNLPPGSYPSASARVERERQGSAESRLPLGDLSSTPALAYLNLSSDAFLIPQLRAIIDRMEENLRKIHDAFEQPKTTSQDEERERKIEEAKELIEKAMSKLEKLRALVKALSSKSASSPEDVAQISAALQEITQIISGIDLSVVDSVPEMKRTLLDLTMSLSQLKGSLPKGKIVV